MSRSYHGIGGRSRRALGISLLALLFSAEAFAADPIPAARHSAISSVQVRALDAARQAEAAKARMLEAQIVAERAAVLANAIAKEYEDLIAKLQTEYRAAGCDLTESLTWKCPDAKPDPKK